MIRAWQSKHPGRRREVCKREQVILEFAGLNVAHERKKAGLMFDHQHGSVVLGFGSSRHVQRKKGMSALPPTAGMCGATRDVRFGPIADSCSAAIDVG
jgi:hypothetical protein